MKICHLSIHLGVGVSRMFQNFAKKLRAIQTQPKFTGSYIKKVCNITVLLLYSKFCDLNFYLLRHILAEFHESFTYRDREINIFLITVIKNF